ncbi:MAG: hypothetical protein IT257_05155, partial [Chitinophagaceae bacterium]|nr:hypothetical protein [Chitinophagaceae bacterium]
MLMIFNVVTSFAHTVDSYTSACNAGPNYSVQPNVSSVNNNSNYAWQYYNGASWVCIVNGNNTINGNVYTVTGATYTATQYPGPIVFTNPNNGLQGLQIRCLISDGANPCNMPAGNTWTSNVNHFISVNGSPCSCNNVTTAGSIGYDETFCGVSFDPSNIVSVSLPTGGMGTIEYVWLVSTDGGNTSNVIAGANSASYNPGVITQTTWYRRCSRRAGCSDYVGESNWVMKSVCPVPQAVAGPTQNLDCNITAATIGTAAVAGYTYNWTPALGLSATGSAQPIATPNVTTTYTVTVANACGCTATSTVLVNVNIAPPTADAGPDKNLNCSVTSATIGTAAIAGSTYSWSPAVGLNVTNVAQPVASPNTTTSYTVTVTGANGCIATDVITVNVNKTPPTVDAGADKNLNCSTTSATIGTAGIAGSSYSWNPSLGLNFNNIAQPVASPNATTTYTVTVTGANGCTASDVVTVNVNTTPPTADAGPDKNLNCSTTSATIGTAGIAGSSYNWSPALGLNASNVAQLVASPAITTTYTVTVTGANGCTSTDVVVVNVNTTPPTVDAGPDKNLNCSVTSTVIGTAAIAGNSYAWLPATGLITASSAMPVVIIATSVTYTITVTGANGCTATDVVVVNVNTTPPTADAGPDKNLNCATTSSAIGTAAIAGSSYSWSPAAGLNANNVAQPVASPNTTTSYTVTVTGANGCTATDVVTVNVNKTPPTVDAGPDKNLNCSLTSATIGTAGIAGSTYNWSPALGLNANNVAQPVASPNTTTSYTVTVTGANGCTAADVVVVNVNTTPPTANAGPDKNLNCSVTSATIGTAGIAGSSYNWSPALGLNANNVAQPVASPNTTTSYTVTVTGANGCTATDVVVVNVNTTPPTVDAGPDKNLDCSVTSATIGTAGIAGSSYNWSPALGLNANNIAQPVASPSTTTSYTVTVTGANGCVATDVVVVNVNTTPPTVDAGPDKNLDCSVTSATIGTAGIAGSSYNWSPALGLNAN